MPYLVQLKHAFTVYAIGNAKEKACNVLMDALILRKMTPEEQSLYKQEE